MSGGSVAWRFGLAAVLLGALAVPPAAARGVAGTKKVLRKAEDHLRGGEWQAAMAETGDVIRDLVAEYARGKGSLPLFGLALAFRAIAEAGLGDLDGATWDWTAAQHISPEVIRFDPARFGAGGVALRDALAEPLREIEIPESDVAPLGVEKPVMISGGPPGYPEAARLSRYQGTINTFVVIDQRGVPVRVAQLDAQDVTFETAIVVNTLETLKKWRFRPARLAGAPVSCTHHLDVNYRLR
jgi:hypothetical protein